MRCRRTNSMPHCMLIAKLLHGDPAPAGPCWILVTLQRKGKEWILQLNEVINELLQNTFLFYGVLKCDAKTSNIKNK